MYCFEFNLNPCVPCTYQQPETFVGDCWVSLYKNRFDAATDSKYARQLLLNIIRDEEGLANGFKYLTTALTEFHPEYYNMFQKMLLLV